MSGNVRRDKIFEPDALWSGRPIRNWEKDALKFFKLWAPLLLVSGVAGGLGAVLFRELIILNKLFFFGFLESHGVSILFLPVIGGMIVGPIIYRWATEAWGHGVPEVMEALMARGGKIRARVAAVKIVASSITIGSGGSAGREGPIAQIGATVSSLFGQLLHVDERTLKLLVMAGASAGISGTFKAPIGGALFGLEVLNKKIRTTDILVMIFSSIVGYVVSVAILGPAPIFTTEGTTLKDLDIPFYLVLGIIGGLVSYVWTRSLYGVEDLFAKFRIERKWFSPFLGAWVVGGIGLLFPESLGLGYSIIDKFFAGTLPIAYTGSLAIFLLFLFLAKLGTSSFTIGSGGSGGVFSPSLFMGAMLGAIYGLMIDNIFPAISPGYKSFALVGMAVIFAGAAKAPLMSTIIVGEMSHNYTLLPGLLVASVMSYLFSGPGSIYMFKLMRTVGRNVPDEYIATPEPPAIVRLARAVMKKEKEGVRTSPEIEKKEKSETDVEMHKVTRSMDIKAPPERIFGFCDNPEDYPLFIPGVNEVSDIQRTDKRVGDACKVKYSLLGAMAEENIICNEYDRPRRISVRFEGPFKSNLKISLEKEEAHVAVNLEYEFEITGGILGRNIQESLVRVRMEKNAERLLENLKILCEVQTVEREAKPKKNP